MLGPFKEDQNSDTDLGRSVHGLAYLKLVSLAPGHNWEALASKNTLQENGGGDIDLAFLSI